MDPTEESNQVNWRVPKGASKINPNAAMLTAEGYQLTRYHKLQNGSQLVTVIYDQSYIEYRLGSLLKDLILDESVSDGKLLNIMRLAIKTIREQHNVKNN